MKRAHSFAASAAITIAVFASAPLAAQSAEPRCTTAYAGQAPPSLYDACQKVFDLFRLITPQVGVALAGGNTMLGETGTLGGPNKASLMIRATAIDGVIPKNSVPVSIGNTPVSSNLGAQRAPIPMLSADVATGVYQGKTVGLTNVAGIDLLLGVTYVPKINKDDISIKTKGSGLSLSYGVRVGILQESAAMPGVSVSYRKRSLPTTTIVFSPGDDSLRVRDASISAQSYRIVAGKHYKFLGIAGGFGRDQVTSKALFDAVIQEGSLKTSGGIPAANDKTTRNNAFVNLSLGLPKTQLVGEMGWSAAGEMRPTINTFDDHKPNEKFRYYSLGISFRP